MIVKFIVLLNTLLASQYNQTYCQCMNILDLPGHPSGTLYQYNDLKLSLPCPFGFQNAPGCGQPYNSNNAIRTRNSALDYLGQLREFKTRAEATAERVGLRFDETCFWCEENDVFCSVPNCCEAQGQGISTPYNLSEAKSLYIFYDFVEGRARAQGRCSENVTERNFFNQWKQKHFVDDKSVLCVHLGKCYIREEKCPKEMYLAEGDYAQAVVEGHLCDSVVHRNYPNYIIETTMATSGVLFIVALLLFFKSYFRRTNHRNISFDTTINRLWENDSEASTDQ